MSGRRFAAPRQFRSDTALRGALTANWLSLTAFLNGYVVTVDEQGGLTVEGNVGFYGASPISKPSVVGSRGGNVALANLLTALANLGLLTDSTS